MKSWLRPVVSLFALLLLASCASLLGPRDVTIPLSTLQEKIAGRFPFNSRYLELLDITVSNPHVSLQPATNRILTSMDAAFLPPFTNKSWTGSFAVSGQLQFDPARNALVLAQPRVENLTVNGLDSPYARQITRIGSFLAEQLLTDIPLYTFQPGELRYGGTAFTPSKITALADALVVTLAPSR
jgi:hypothetical protein